MESVSKTRVLKAAFVATSRWYEAACGDSFHDNTGRIFCCIAPSAGDARTGAAGGTLVGVALISAEKSLASPPLSTDFIR